MFKLDGIGYKQSASLRKLEELKQSSKKRSVWKKIEKISGITSLGSGAAGIFSGFAFMYIDTLETRKFLSDIGDFQGNHLAYRQAMRQGDLLGATHIAVNMPELHLHQSWMNKLSLGGLLGGIGTSIASGIVWMISVFKK